MHCFRQESSRLSVLITALLIAASGCGAKTHEQKHADQIPGQRNVHINGIDYELPWPVDAVEVIKAGQLEAAQKGFTFANDHYKLEVINGRLKLNGKEYGSINRGDRVKLTEGGVLSVNGGERKPQ